MVLPAVSCPHLGRGAKPFGGKEAETRIVMKKKKPRAILTLGGLVESPAPASARPQPPPLRDAIAALADAGLPLFERMRAEGRCLPMKINIWPEIASRTDSALHAALKSQIAALARSRPYLEGCAAEGAMRHDLDGKAVEPVTDEHRRRAARRGST
jgi:hypothetical protein